MYMVWHVDKYKITFKLVINWTNEILQHIVVFSGLSQPGIIDARAQYRAAAQQLRNTALRDEVNDRAYQENSLRMSQAISLSVVKHSCTKIKTLLHQPLHNNRHTDVYDCRKLKFFQRNIVDPFYFISHIFAIQLVFLKKCH